MPPAASEVASSDHMSSASTNAPSGQQDAAQIAALKAVRLRAVKDAYWAASGTVRDLNVFADILEACAGIESPTKSQQRALFDLLPESIVGAGIAHGFDSRRVRTMLAKFAQEMSAEARGAIESS